MDEIYITHFETEIPDCPEIRKEPPGDLSANLRRLRWEHNFSLSEVSRAVGISRTQLNKYEMGGGSCSESIRYIVYVSSTR